ncbi:hypothetical protein FGG08_007605 [Glutinoglossum americanum]|uniref:Uncharacterized protein n=1 Tax=Glutinoglossum americanum TaxID=1670608 RepID=A0A9P8KW87_9PEZI|nr:hypothetical protein FGG08_007605 [Glutinoglossum americanum]
MPTDAECLAFWNEENARGFDGLMHMGDAVEARWPRRADYMAYFNWSKKRREDEMMQPSLVPQEDVKENIPALQEQLKTMIATTNYNSSTDRGKLAGALNRMIAPWLPVGRDRNGSIYRVVPGAYEMWPDRPDPETDREVLGKNVLGVNTNVQPEIPVHSRKAEFSESTKPGEESGDPEVGGFIFHQIGTLEHWGGWRRELSCQDIKNGPWDPTEFYVVVRFGRNGAANGIYIIYNFYPEDEFGGYVRGQKISDEYWGYLRWGDQQFSIAKIADDITELEFSHTLSLAETVDYPVEIVRAVETSGGAIVRATVAQ